MNSRLAIGAVQFGLPYGIANQVGQVSRDEVAKILGHAWAAGMDTLDTAIGYGDSEAILGEIEVDQWQVITKLPEVPEACADVASWVQELVAGSLGRLRVPRLRGLLLHRPQQLLGPHGDELYRALAGVRDQGKAEKIGVSVYGPDELDAIWPRYQFDLVQSPFNILDRRLVSSGWLNRLCKAGTEVHVRSVFLQGLLLMDAANRPGKFNRWQSLWDDWQRWLTDHALTPLQACLSFAISQPEINRVVVGVDSLEQLRGVFACAENTVNIPPETLMSDDLDLINPSCWSSL
jgi:aryl-alcohol dehydrogenase-like predicted oxidoreductase